MSPDDRAAELVGRALDIQGKVSPADTMLTLAAWTSLSHVRLVLELEAALDRPLTAAEIGSLESVAAVARLLGK